MGDRFNTVPIIEGAGDWFNIASAAVSTVRSDTTFFFFLLPLFLLGILGTPPYNALTGPDWPVREGSLFMKHGIPCCWLVVELGAPKSKD